jgi:hypothetical protein
VCKDTRGLVCTHNLIVICCIKKLSVKNFDYENNGVLLYTPQKRCLSPTTYLKTVGAVSIKILVTHALNATPTGVVVYALHATVQANDASRVHGNTTKTP